MLWCLMHDSIFSVWGPNSRVGLISAIHLLKGDLSLVEFSFTPQSICHVSDPLGGTREQSCYVTSSNEK